MAKKATRSLKRRAGSFVKTKKRTPFTRKSKIKKPAPKKRAPKAPLKRRLKKYVLSAKKKTGGIRGQTQKASIKKKVTRARKSIKRQPSIAVRETAGKAAILAKSKKNPILMPTERNSWESYQTFNPAALYEGGRVHLLYRALGDDGMSALGYASSKDGSHFDDRLPRPVFFSSVRPRTAYNPVVYASGGGWGGCEDPRIVRVGDEDTLYMTYTACNDGLRVGLASIQLRDFLNKEWAWRPAVLISPPGEIHKNWVIFPEKIKGKYAILHSINPDISIEYVDSLEFEKGEYIKSRHGGAARKRGWDSQVRGAGPPPIKTQWGWLLLYHAIDRKDPGKYKIGAMLLDLANPAKVLHRSKEPILEPDRPYENEGFKGGIVYACGAVVKEGALLVYYGGADSYVCMASANLEQFVQSLMHGEKPKMEQKKSGKPRK